MSCENYKTELRAAAAAGLADAALAEHLAGHLDACVGCREWFASEQSLFSAIDAGVSRAVGQSPSAEFLPRVRAAIELEKSGRTLRVPNSWFTLWPISAAVAAACLALVFVGRFHSRSVVQPQPAVAVASSGGPVAPLPVSQPAVEAGGHRPAGVRHTVVKSERASAGWADAEVLVSSDEREALVHFVAGLPARREMAIALARPAPFQPSFQPAPDETAAGPLEIAELEVKPLIPAEEK